MLPNIFFVQTADLKFIYFGLSMRYKKITTDKQREMYLKDNVFQQGEQFFDKETGRHRVIVRKWDKKTRSGCSVLW